MVSNVTFSIAEGKMEEFLAYLDSIKKDVHSWEGLISSNFAKASDTSIVTWSVYDDQAAMDANAEKFKVAMGGVAGLLAAPPSRVVGSVVVEW